MKKAKCEVTKKILYSQIIVFALIVAYFVVSGFWELGRLFFILLAVLGLAFLVLGVVLALKARKEQGKLKFFLMLAGISAVAPFAFSILHNVFYGLGMFFEQISILRYVFEGLHVASFIISLLVAPITFIVGVVGSLVLLRKEEN